jgi:multicomponent Na+:H+ antiporter subunit B
MKEASENLLLRWTAALMLVVLNVVAVYLLLRGHHLPGGGFIAGLVSGLSVLLYGLATDLPELEDRLGVDPLRLAALGLGLALVSALIPVGTGEAFLLHFQGYLEIPVWGSLYWGTPLLFDLGVMILVMGITTKIILVLARSTSGRAPMSEQTRTRYAAAVERPIEELWKKKEDGNGL